MKLRTLISTMAAVLGIGMALNAPARAQAPERCAVFMCMAGVSGYGTSGLNCAPAIAVFHSIQIWSPWFNSSATAGARRTYLSSCQAATGVNQGALKAIIAQRGTRPDAGWMA